MKTQTRISRAFAPVSDLVVLNAETTGTILLRQNALAKDLISASVDQVKLLSEAGSVRDALNFQRAYLRDMGTRVRSTTRENLDTLRHAGRDARGVLRDTLRNARSEAAEAVNEATESVSEAVEETAESVSEAVEQAGTETAAGVAPAAATVPAPQERPAY